METKQRVFRLNILYPHVTLSRAHMPCTRLVRTWQYRRLCLRATKTSTWERGREMHPAWINFFQAYEIQRYLGMRSKAATVDIEKVVVFFSSFPAAQPWTVTISGPSIVYVNTLYKFICSCTTGVTCSVKWWFKSFPQGSVTMSGNSELTHCLSTFHPFCCLHSNHRTEWRVQTWPKVEPLKMYLHNS